MKTAYKQTEIGVIPEDWEVKKLEDVAEIIGGGTPSTFVSDYWNGDINWFTPTEIGTEKYVFDSVRKITKDGLINCSARILPIGTILLTSRAGIGDISILKKEACTNQGFQSLVAKKGFYNEFLYYLVSTLKNVLIQNASGSTFLEISPNKIKQIQISIPRVEEQTAIAAALSDVDALMGELDRLIAKKQGIKQATMQQLLTGKKRLAGFSGEWEVKRLGEVVDIKKGQLITEKDAVSGDIPVIAGGKKPAYFHNRANRNGKTITISASGASAGYVAFFDSPIFASDCSTISEGINYSIEFVYYQLQLKQDLIYKAQTGGAQPHIHVSDLAPLQFHFPDLCEQTAIATILSDMDAEINALQQKRDKTAQLKQGMMQELLTGRIRLIGGNA